MMENERIDPLAAHHAMQGMQWHSHLLEHILKQDPTAAPAFLHRLLLP